MAEEPRFERMEKQIDKLGDKIDDLTKVVTVMARIEERMITLFKRMETYEDRHDTLDVRLTSVEQNTTQRGVVDRVLDHRRVGRAKRVQYLVLWKGYPLSEATWESIENMDGALDLVIEYNKRYKVNLNVVTVQYMSTSYASVAKSGINSSSVSSQEKWKHWVKSLED